MTEVIIHDDKHFERAEIFSDLLKHRHYEKPSERRKRTQSVVQRPPRRGLPRTARS